MFHNFNTQLNAAKHNNNGNKYRNNTTNNKLKLRLKGTAAELMYIGCHSDGFQEDWMSVLEFCNWTALRTLDLGITIITQGDAASTTLVLNSSVACHGSIFDF